jgi:hypothetical protein
MMDGVPENFAMTSDAKQNCRRGFTPRLARRRISHRVVKPLLQIPTVAGMETGDQLLK